MINIEEYLLKLANITGENGLLVDGATFAGDLTIDLTITNGLISATNALLTTIDGDTGAIKIATEATQAALEGDVQDSLDALNATAGTAVATETILSEATRTAVATEATQTADEAIQTAIEGDVQTALDTLVSDIAIIKADTAIMKANQVAGFTLVSGEKLDGTSAADQSAAIGSTGKVWVQITAINTVTFQIGSNPTATNDTPSHCIAAGTTIVRQMTGGHKISVLGGVAWVSLMDAVTAIS
jgi:hypothetical protein